MRNKSSKVKGGLKIGNSFFNLKENIFLQTFVQIIIEFGAKYQLFTHIYIPAIVNKYIFF